MNEILVPLHVERLPEGQFLATSESLPGLVAQGRTMEETLEIARDVAKKLIESLQEHGDPLPADLRPMPTQYDLVTPIGV
jgi:predicted RNase H-like HicB family nuclease